MSTENRYKWSVALTTFIFFVLLLAAVKTGYAQSKDEAYTVENFNTSGDVNLEVQTSGGSIKVIGSSNGEVSVEMYVRHRGKYIAPGEAKLDDYEIDISQSGNTIKAISKRESRGGWIWNRDGYSISFIVYTPNETRTRLKTSGGSLTAKNLTGSQELRTSGGSITTEGIVGKQLLKTSGGSINITDTQGEVEANTSGGRIIAKSVVGGMDARTSGGSITLEGMEGNVSAKTSGGSIRAEILSPHDFIELRTSGGSIGITVPKENGYTLDLDGSRVRTELINFNGESERDEIRGKMNGGGTVVRAKTSGGSVTMNYL
ncbi:MAG: hypothetical protein WD059_07490 [Balneolaceae bacterium]